jgi:tellurite resistance protein TehA-like permease
MIADISKAVAPASVSVSSTVLSFFATSLPILQGVSAIVAIVSGVLAIVWVVIQIRDRFKKR